MLNYSKYNRELDEAKNGGKLRRAGFIFFGVTSGLLLVLLTIDWAKTQSVFDFENIIVEGNHFLSESEVTQLAKIDTKKNLFEIDLRAVEERVAKHQLVREVRVSRRLPGSIVIKVVERQPLAVINRTPIDAEGRLLTRLNLKSENEYPLITNITYSGKISEKLEIQRILDFLSFAKHHQLEFYKQIEKISHSKKHGVYFYVTGSKAKIIFGDENFADRTSNFLTVRDHLQNEGKTAAVEYFDLRFQQQVIVKAAGKS